jgi:hypothetical protein
VRGALAWRDVRIVVVLFCGAQMLDAVTTYIALSSHRFEETNPLLGPALDSHPLAAFAVKLALAAVVVTVLLAMRLRWRLRLAVVGLFTLASAVAPVVNIVRLTGS